MKKEKVSWSKIAVLLIGNFWMIASLIIAIASTVSYLFFDMKLASYALAIFFSCVAFATNLLVAIYGILVRIHQTTKGITAGLVLISTTLHKGAKDNGSKKEVQNKQKDSTKEEEAITSFNESKKGKTEENNIKEEENRTT